MVVDEDAEFLKLVEAACERVYRLLLVPFHMKSQSFGLFSFKRKTHSIKFGCLPDDLFKCHIVKDKTFCCRLGWGFGVGQVFLGYGGVSGNRLYRSYDDAAEYITRLADVSNIKEAAPQRPRTNRVDEPGDGWAM